MSERAQAQNILGNLGTLLPDLESVYKDIHSHPELSMQENRTAGIAAHRLHAAGYEVTTGVGKTGVVGVLRNGDGPTGTARHDRNLRRNRHTLRRDHLGRRQLRNPTVRSRSSRLDASGEH